MSFNIKRHIHTCVIFRWVGDTSDVHKVEKQRLEVLLFDEAQAKYSEIAGSMTTDQLKVEHQHQNRRMGVTKAQYIETTMDFMEKRGVFKRRYEKLFDQQQMCYRMMSSNLKKCAV